MRNFKYFYRIISLVLLACLLCVLSSCSTKLLGTYTNDEGLIKQSFTFKEENIVAVTAFGISIEGEYSIEDETITIKYSLGDLSYEWSKTFEKDGSTIIIDGTKFIKEE